MRAHMNTHTHIMAIIEDSVDYNIDTSHGTLPKRLEYDDVKYIN